MVEGGRRACGKTPVFWIYERSGCVYTEIVSDSSKATLQAYPGQDVHPQSLVNSDGFRGIARVRLTKFRGMVPQVFSLQLKETEFRYNHRKEHLGRLILKMCRSEPLN